LTMLERSIRVQKDHPEEFGRDSVEAHMVSRRLASTAT
jgi:hypothetical protein